MDDDKRRSLEEWSAKLRALREERARGAHAFEVRMRVSGTLVYRVRADSKEEAESKAWDLYEEEADPYDDFTECTDASARLLPELPTAEKP